ncbi:hypothetical protein JCM19237_6715 [Photobacterium aphoticum]|uniref:Uncharacterized protein n=1 Tax=Photobacterium aphoticum TaxID=754436 RepID=A0A090QLL0_9GAMM|nr:hypothetical protein JCM19237_6715 [Photobacterium aphoticum]
MFKLIKQLFKSLELYSAVLEKKSEQLLLESQTQLNEYIENNGGIEKIKERTNEKRMKC